MRCALVTGVQTCALPISLGLQQSCDFSIVGVGSEEYRRVVTASAWVFGIIATTGLLFQAQMARGYLLIALPVGLVGLLTGRHLLRRNLMKKRLQLGRASCRQTVSEFV